MKKIIFATLSLLSLNAIAQREITVRQDTLPMSKGTKYSYQVIIPQTTLKEVEKDWMKYTGEGSKEKVTTINGENFQPASLSKNVSPNPFNVYSKLLETSEGVKLTAWLTENDTVFFAKEVNSDQNIAAEKYVRDFAIQEYRNIVKTELKAEQEKQKDLEKELKELIKQEEKSNKKIGENQRAIQRANEDIATNNRDIEKRGYDIQDQKRMVDRTASDENANKGAKKTLKELQNDKKKLQKQNEQNGKDIDKLNGEIREEERNIGAMRGQQIAKTAEIDKQKQKVNEVQMKLDNIK